MLAEIPTRWAWLAYLGLAENSGDCWKQTSDGLPRGRDSNRSGNAYTKLSLGRASRARPGLYGIRIEMMTRGDPLCVKGVNERCPSMRVEVLINVSPRASRTRGQRKAKIKVPNRTMEIVERLGFVGHEVGSPSQSYE
jgi:hypothetical protein